MPSKCCCVPKRYNKDDRCYRITTIKGVQEVWIERIGNPDLANLSDVSNASICKKHFHAECIGSDGKLKKFALPTLNLPEYANSPQNDDLFLYSLIEPKPSGSSRKTQETTLLDEGPELKVQIPRKVYTRKRNVIGNELAGPSRHTQVLELISNEDQIASGSNYIEEIPTFLEGEASISKCHEISLVADEVPGTSRNIRGEITISESDALLLCPDELPSTSRNTRDPEPINWGAKMAQRRKTCTHSAPLKKQLRYFRRKEREAHSKNKTLKSMMRAIQDSKYLENLRKMNKISQNFFMSQVKNQGLKARGRRFTIEDKIFALSLYKQSGKGYRYLSKIFSLPSRRTLLNLLNGIPFDCGINNQIFSSLKNSVGKLEVLDKYCVLMFDEVALSSSLSYNFSKDCMEGLVDLGNGDRRGQLADHALVFMLKSISGQWKQPLCFYFVEYSVKTIDLVKIIKDVVRHVRQAGLTIVATISDQGATNVAAINKLIEATREYSLRNGGENTLQGYIVDNKEIVHLYDPPHLLKGIRNALLTKDLHFRQDGVQKVASWEHIVKTFEIDAAINIYSSIPKLTEEHVLPHKIKKMLALMSKLSFISKIK